MELGKNICELRKSKGVTQEELAAQLGVTAAAVSKWEKGYTLPDVLMVCAIADYFGITTDELLGKCDLGDCSYDEPEDLHVNLDTILSMMEKHF